MDGRKEGRDGDKWGVVWVFRGFGRFVLIGYCFFFRFFFIVVIRLLFVMKVRVSSGSVLEVRVVILRERETLVMLVFIVLCFGCFLFRWFVFTLFFFRYRLGIRCCYG